MLKIKIYTVPFCSHYQRASCSLRDEPAGHRLSLTIYGNDMTVISEHLRRLISFQLTNCQDYPEPQTGHLLPANCGQHVSSRQH